MDPDHRIREAPTCSADLKRLAASARSPYCSRIGSTYPTSSTGRTAELSSGGQHVTPGSTMCLPTPSTPAGKYARSTSFTAKVQNGRKVIKSRDLRRPEQWKILITKHHEGYISWDQYERNQRAPRATSA